MTFSTFFTVIAGKKLGLREMQLAQESINFGSMANINKMLMGIVGTVLACEGIGALLMSTAFIPRYGVGEGIYISCFLAVSAFCNAGFDVLGRESEYISLCNYNGVPIVMYTIMALIIVGGLGFVVWKDIASYKSSKKLTLQSRVVLSMTALLILSGALFFWAYEWNNTMSGLSFGEKITAGFFQSVTCRTAGFNSIDQATLNPISKGISTMLMFIGAVPGSTGGGVKITTFSVLIMTVASVLRGREEVVMWNRRVDKSVVYKAVTIMVCAAALVLVASFIISFLLPQCAFLDIIFECTSAFATVGLSSGVTGEADTISKLILTLLMYLGRVGPVSFALSLVAGSSSRKEIMPEGQDCGGLSSPKRICYKKNCPVAGSDQFFFCAVLRLHDIGHITDNAFHILHGTVGSFLHLAALTGCGHVGCGIHGSAGSQPHSQSGHNAGGGTVHAFHLVFLCRGR